MKPVVLGGRYKVVRELGRGGAGVVYLCLDSRLPGSAWAVKEVVNQAGTEAFEREARMLANLKHSGLPVVVDFFVGGGRYYLVQEYVDGPTLAEYVEQKGSVHERLALEWGLELAEILDYLHSQTPPVLHNDLKPGNVVSAAAGLKLIDFGLARFKGPEGEPSPASGSLGYSPPEQWDAGASVDETSDIYSWGATLYFLLTGLPPSPVPGEHRIRHRRPELDLEAERLILACLSSESSKRPTSVSEIVNSLQFILCKLPVVSGPYRPGQVVSSLPVERAPARVRSAPLFVYPLLLLILGGFFLALASHRGPAFVTPRPAPVAADFALALLQKGDLQRANEEATRLLVHNPESALDKLVKLNSELLLSPPANLVHIPALVPLTGEYSEDGNWMLQGLLLAACQLRRQGHPAHFDVRDTASQGAQTLAQMQSLAANSTVSVVLGPFGSPNLLLVAPLCNGARLPVVAPYANDPRVAQAGPYVYAVAHSQLERVRAILAHLKNHGLLRGVIFQSDNGLVFGSSADVVEQDVTSWGGRILQRVHYQADPGRAVADWTQRDCDFVYVADNRSGPLARLVTALRQAGFQGTIATQGHVGSLEFLRQGGKDVEGVLLSTPLDSASRIPAVRRFFEDYAREFPSTPLSPLCGVTYDTAMMVGQALRAGGSRQKVQEALSSIGHSKPLYRGVSGQFRPSEASSESVVSRLVTIRDGHYVAVP